MFFHNKKIILCGMIFFINIFPKYQIDKYQMEILIVVPSFPKVHDVCMLNQITGLIQRGHNVTIYAEKPGDFSVVQEDVIKYDLLSRTIVGTLPSNLNDYDIIVFQLGHRAVNLKKTHGFTGKIVICLRGYDITSFVKQNPHAYDEFFKDCDLFMPVCNVFKRKLISLGCPRNKIVVHHSAIDCSRFIATNTKALEKNKLINIISAGRFVEKKGFEYSIRAMSYLLKKYPSIRYTIIGEGELKPVYEKLIRKLGIGNRVFLDTWHSHGEYISILNDAHIFVLCSVTAKNDDQEGIPNVLKEAMLMEKIVVGTDHSGNSELIEDGVSGFLVPERSSKALYRALDFAIMHYEKLKKMQKVARKKVLEEFDRERENDKLESIFLSLINKK